MVSVNHETKPIGHLNISILPLKAGDMQASKFRLLQRLGSPPLTKNGCSMVSK